MTLQEMEAFVALAETGSINRAALHLHLTQPATTRRIQNFEAALGATTTLLNRSAKPPVLTPMGRKVLEHCRIVLKAVAELRVSMSGSDQPVGDLRIGVAPGLGEVVLGAPLDDLQRHFPGVRLQVSSYWTARLIEEVRNGALDCAFGHITPEHALPPGMHVAALGLESVIVVTAKGAKLRSKGKGRPSLRDLVGEGWVLNPVGCGCRAALQRAHDRAKAPMHVTAEVFGEDLQLSMIARRGGLGFVPRRQLEQSPHRSRLRIVSVSDFALEAKIAMLHGQALGSIVSAVDWLQAQIADRLAVHK